MAKKLFVGNLPYSATEDQLRDMAAEFGEVLSVRIITDQYTGRSRGFGFIEMENADAALSQLNGKELDGRPLRINEANERPRPSGMGGGRGGRPGGGGGRDRGRAGGGGGGGRRGGFNRREY